MSKTCLLFPKFRKIHQPEDPIQSSLCWKMQKHRQRDSPRSSQHCLCPPNVLAGSVNSRCIGHRWLTATSVAQIPLGKKKGKAFFLLSPWPTIPSALGKKKLPNMSVESIWHLKWQGKCLSCACTHNGHGKHQLILPNCPQIRKAEHEAEDEVQVARCTFWCCVSNFHHCIHKY